MVLISDSDSVLISDSDSVLISDSDSILISIPIPIRFWFPIPTPIRFWFPIPTTIILYGIPFPSLRQKVTRQFKRGIRVSHFGFRCLVMMSR